LKEKEWVIQCLHCNVQPNAAKVFNEVSSTQMAKRTLDFCVLERCKKGLLQSDLNHLKIQTENATTI